MKVSDTMRAEANPVRADQPIIAAVERMAGSQYPSIPVVEDDGRLKGILRAWDVVALLASGVDIHTARTGDVATGFAAVEADQSMEAALRVALAEQADLLPVVRDGRLVGSLTSYAFRAQDVLTDLLGARTPGLVTDISPDDRSFGGDRGSYLLAGASAVEAVSRMLKAAGREKPDPILVLPCDHGRVLRVLKAFAPDAEITAGDFDRAAVDYCVEAFGATPAHVDPDPSKIELPRHYDLIWVGALLPGIDPDDWPAFLTMFRDHLAADGVLVFSTLAWQNSSALRSLGVPESAMEGLQTDYDDRGFARCSELVDGGGDLSLTSAGWVRWLVSRLPGLRLVKHLSSIWETPYPRQDVVACVRNDD